MIPRLGVGVYCCVLQRDSRGDVKIGAELGPCQVSGGGGLNSSWELPHLRYLSALGASLEKELIPAPLVKTLVSDGLSGLITNALKRLFHM